MKNMLFLAAAAVFLALPIAAQKTDDEKAAIGVVNKLFDAMAAADQAGILAVHTPTSDLAAMFKQKDGKSRYSAINGEAFSKMFTKPGGVKEIMYAPKVEVSGDWAMVWGRYVFYSGEKLSHCGINQFNLVRTEAGWKIANGASTIDPGACTDAEKAMKFTGPVK